jgi:hypothetical protein
VKLVRADYSVSVFDVFKNVCLFMVEFEKRVAFLQHCDIANEDSVQAHPTWVPNWLRSTNYEPFLYMFTSGYVIIF